MPDRKVILYVHGMGGGGDSRIPSILKDSLGPGYEVVIRTYDFDPEKAREQISSWAAEVRPDLVIGESMGATHAITLRGYPHLFVSPSLNAPYFFRVLAVLAWIPGVTRFFDWYYKPKKGDRQAGASFRQENPSQVEGCSKGCIAEHAPEWQQGQFLCLLRFP